MPLKSRNVHKILWFDNYDNTLQSVVLAILEISDHLSVLYSLVVMYQNVET